MALLGAPASILFFPRCNSGSYSPSPFYNQTPYWIFFPPGPGQFSPPLFPCVFFCFTSFFFISVPFLLSLCFSHSLSFIIDQFLFLFLPSPIPLFPAISYRFIFCPSSATQTLLLLSLFTSV